MADNTETMNALRDAYVAALRMVDVRNAERAIRDNLETLIAASFPDREQAARVLVPFSRHLDAISKACTAAEILDHDAIDRVLRGG